MPLAEGRAVSRSEGRAAEGSAAANELPIMNLFPIPEMRPLMSRIPVHSLDDAPEHQSSQACAHPAVTLFIKLRDRYARARLGVPSAPTLS